MTQANTDRRLLAPAALVAVAATVISGWIYGPGVFFLVLAGSILLLVTWVFWRSLQSLTGDAPLSLEEALGLTAPSAEEERKLAVLRALKDLEYERGLGKISEDDYRELSRKYRTEAKRLLQLLDEQLEPARRRAEQLVEQHLSQLEQTTPQRSASPKSLLEASPERTEEADAAPAPETADAPEISASPEAAHPGPAPETPDVSEASASPEGSSAAPPPKNASGKPEGDHGAPDSSPATTTTPRSAIQTRKAAHGTEATPAGDDSSEPEASALPAPAPKQQH